MTDGLMGPSRIGSIVQAVWNELPDRFSGIELDCFVLMPNHVHGVVTLVGAGLALPELAGAASSPPTFADVVRAFKSISAIRTNRFLGRTGPLWQRGYFEHIIRHEDALQRIREYVADNPLRWNSDPENPTRTGASSNRKAEPWEV
ncbi:MAG: transposase [bacterium]